MPPPATTFPIGCPYALPWVSVTSEIDAVASFWTWTTRSMFCASMTVVFDPAPRIVTSPVMSRSPVAHASSLLPFTVSLYFPAGRLICTGPPRRFAFWIAARSVTWSPGLTGSASTWPSPRSKSAPSFVVLTSKTTGGTAGAGALRPRSIAEADAITRGLRFFMGSPRSQSRLRRGRTEHTGRAGELHEPGAADGPGCA
jgi:hypothetical protein